MKFFRTAILASVCVLVGVNASSAGHGQLSGDDIEATLSGATAKGKTDKGKPWSVRYLVDGSAKFSLNDNSFADQGKWWVEGDRYCAQWKKIRKGAKGCWHVEHRQDATYVFEGIDGVPDTQVEIAK
jgi:hypothetical protein